MIHSSEKDELTTMNMEATIIDMKNRTELVFELSTYFNFAEF